MSTDTGTSRSVLLRLGPLDTILEAAAICVGYVLAPSSSDGTPLDLNSIDLAMRRVADKWRLLAGRTEWIAREKIWGIRAPLGPLPPRYRTHTFTSTTIPTAAPFPMPSFSPSSATYFTQPPRRYFVHLKTPLGNKSYSSTPLISIHATVFTDCICLGVTYPHGVFDGVGIGHVLKALGAELHGREWAVPELDEANIVTQLLDGCDVSPDDSLVSKNYTRANVWGLVTFLVSMAVQYVWHGVEPGGIHVGKEVVDRIVKKVKEEVRVESGGKEYVSTSDVMLAWALKAAYLDESVSSTPLKVAQSVSPRQVDASFEQYPHNATLLADLPPLSLASLASTPLSTLALQSRVSIVRTRSLANAKLQLLSPTGAILPRREWGTEWFGFSSQVKGGYDQIEWGTETRCIVGYPLPLNADHLLFVYELNGCYTFVGDLKKSRWESMKSELKRLEEGNVSKVI